MEAQQEIIEVAASQAGVFAELKERDNDVVSDMVRHAYAGGPSRNDAMLRAALGAEAHEVDDAGQDWLIFLPIVPFDGIQSPEPTSTRRDQYQNRNSTRVDS